jgi:cation diffusion facilitator CzcD-associated flavoprotein CzcO
MAFETSQQTKAGAQRLIEIDVVVVGAGFAGLYALHHMRELGFSARAYEAGGGVGGTWYWNRYPGARVDIESIEYSYSFSEELQQEWSWSERYAAQPELLRYLNHVADRFDLRRDLQLNTRVNSAVFDENTNRWLIETSQGDRLSAQFCIMATGLLSASNKPNIKGLDTFRGKQYHTSQWPHEGVDFTGQRVGVVGTGSSGVQSIPVIAQQAQHLFVFQRTPNFSIPLRNCPMPPDYEQAVKRNYKEWRAKEMESFGGYIALDFKLGVPQTKSALAVTPEERLADYELRWKSGGISYYTSFPDLLVNPEANATLAAFVRAKIHAKVNDPKLAERLIPQGYPIMTKRLCADTGYYETYNRENVTLVDIKNTPIDEVTPTGVRVDDREYALDSLVFATGFDAVTGALNKIDIRGRGGRQLKEQWAHGPRTYLGLMSAGFPNLFMVDGPGSPGAFFQPILLSEYQVQWIGSCLTYLRAHNSGSIESTEQAEAEWTRHGVEVADQTLFNLSDNWYMGANIPGKPRVMLMYIGGFQEYSRRLKEATTTRYRDFQLGAIAQPA